MDNAAESTQAGERPGGQVGTTRAPRAGQSGEGALSALEQLIQQEQKRVAQLPREDAPAAAKGTRRA
jgi:hypothetical protein